VFYIVFHLYDNMSMGQQPTADKEVLARRLAESAYIEIERKYGEKGVSPKAFHNVFHGREIVKSALLIADEAIKSGKISPEDRFLLIIAGAYHDIEQDLGSGANEIASAAKAEQAMKDSGQFNKQEIEIVKDAILGTTVVFENGIIRQSASGNPLSQMIADADLANLGSPTEVFWDRSEHIFREQYPDGNGMDEFLEFQTGLLTHHTYCTEEAKILFPHQRENLEFNAQMIAERK